MVELAIMNQQSILEPIRDYILNVCTDLEAGRAVVLEQLCKAPNADNDIRRMKVVVQYQIHNLTKLKFFVNDMILARKGLKV